MTPLDKTSPSRLLFIDSLRGVAALWVMVFHYYNAIGGSAALHVPTGLQWFFISGDQGVFIFFVLSGFVISNSVKWNSLSGIYILRFIAKRSVRLDPPYWVVIILTGLSIYFMSSMGLLSLASPSSIDYLTNMFYLDNLLGERSIVAVGWTLQYEIQFYLFFILSAWLLRISGFTPSSSYYAFLLTGVISVLYWFDWFPFKVNGLFVKYWMYFLLGLLTHWSFAREISFAKLSIMMCVIIFHFMFFVELSGVVALATSILLVLADKLDAFSRWLNFRWLTFLGTISYSLYLLHPFFGNRLLRFIHEKIRPDGIAAWGIYIGVIFLTIVVVYCFYYVVERPSLHFSRKIKLK